LEVIVGSAWGNNFVPTGGNKNFGDGWVGPDPAQFKPAKEGGEPEGFAIAMPFKAKDGRDHGLCLKCASLRPAGKGRKKMGEDLCTFHLMSVKRAAKKVEEPVKTPVPTSFVTDDYDEDE
jgi:hypothetical protein